MNVKMLAISLTTGILLSLASVLYVSYNKADALADAKRGFPLGYAIIGSGTACHTGVQAELGSVFEAGRCDRKLDITRLTLNTLFWVGISAGVVISTSKGMSHRNK